MNKLEELDALVKALDAIAEKDEVLAETYTVSALADACLNEAGLLRQAAALLRAQAEEIARKDAALSTIETVADNERMDATDTHYAVMLAGIQQTARAALGSPPDA